jgi:3-oxoacyl-[acyl-carrier-protein] synthase-3
MTLYLNSMGTFHPERKITNSFLEQLDVGTSAAWIEEKIGILERVTTLPLEYIATTRNQDPKEAVKVASHSPTDMAVIAANRALLALKIDAKEIGMLVVNSCTPQSFLPSEAHVVAERLNLPSLGLYYDVTTACPAFALHVDFLNSFRIEKLPRYILCVCTAAFTQVVNYNDRTDGAIWGDGACAWIMSPSEPGKLQVVDTFFTADPTRADSVVIRRGGHFHQDGRAVRDFSVRQTVRLLKRLEESFELNWEKDIFIGHQANRTMLEQVAKNRGIGAANHWHNVTYLGNQAAAGAPAVLSTEWDKLTKGQRIAVAVVGAGLSWGSVLLECVT